MPPEISDEMLMAYADGALDEPQFSQISDALERDPQLGVRLEALVSGSVLARKGFETLLTPASPKLEDAVRAQIRASSRRARWAWPGLGWLVPLGSAVAATLTIVLGWSVMQPPPSGGVAPFAELSGPQLAAVLDRLPSGETEALASGLVVSPVTTFRDEGGRLCREFETAGTAEYLAVSCRSGESWTVQLALAGAPEDDSYRPASGGELLELYLQSIGAGAPLLDEAEAQALEPVP